MKSIFEKSSKRYAWIATCTLLTITATMGLALILPERQDVFDFVMLYAANRGVIYRVPIYDTQALMDLMVTQFHLSGTFSLFPYPYPPWFALSTCFLALLPPQKAVNAWMLLNIAMLVVCTLLWTVKWKPLPRLLAILATLIFIPALGLIVVGQYSAPVLLGASLFIYAARKEDALLTALALLLMTFKPHLGLFLLPCCFFWLMFQRTSFARRAIWLTLAGGIFLAAIGFLADPAWPLTYLRALLGYSTISGVSSLGISAGFSAMLIKLIFGQGNAIWSTGLSAIIVVCLFVILWRFKVYATVETLVSAGILLTLLGDPYLLNYDYVTLLLPLAFLWREVKTPINRIVLAIIYLIPWFSLLFGRTLDILYALSAICLLILLLRNIKSRQAPTQALAEKFEPSTLRSP